VRVTVDPADRSTSGASDLWEEFARGQTWVTLPGRCCMKCRTTGNRASPNCWTNGTPNGTGRMIFRFKGPGRRREEPLHALPPWLLESISREEPRRDRSAKIESRLTMTAGPAKYRTYEFAERVGFGCGWRSLRPICLREGIGHRINGLWFFSDRDVERIREATRLESGSDQCHSKPITTPPRHLPHSRDASRDQRRPKRWNSLAT